MARRRKYKNVRKLNGKNYRRPSANRTAEFFDLRETEENTDANRDARSWSGREDESYGSYAGQDSGSYGRNTGSYAGQNSGSYGRSTGSYAGQNSGSYGRSTGSYAGQNSGSYGRSTGSYAGQNSGSFGRYGSTGGGDESQRPYRERHRVEVNTQDSYSGYSYRRQGSSDGYSAYGGYDEEEADLYGSGQRRESRIIHGNVPGNRKGKNDAADTREISSDLLYSSGRSVRKASGDRSTRSGTRNSSYSPYGRSNYFSYGSDNRQNTSDGRYSTYGRDVEYEEEYDNDPYDDGITEEDLRGYEREYNAYYEDQLPQDDRDYNDPYDEGEEPEDDEADSRAGHGRRLRQRAQSRRAREKELRSFYLKCGIGAIVLLLFLILAIPRIFKPAGSSENQADQGEQGEAVAVSQEGSSKDEETNDAEVTAAGQEDAASGQKDTDAAEDGSAQTADSEEGSEIAAQADTSAAAVTEDTQEEQAESGDTAAASEPDGEGTGQNQLADGEVGNISPVAVGTVLETAAASGKYAKQDDWRFILVNPWYILPEEYAEVSTSSLPNGESVDARCYKELLQLLDDCRKAGGEPVVCSSYRPHAKQVTLYEEQVKKLMEEGKTKEQAQVEAGTVVAVPGTSEHEIGLAVDICDYNNQNLDDTQAETVTQKWLMEHSWEYGFILRYPDNKSDITGIIYEPWHYRYVGKEAAKEITEKGICLEEYLEL